MCAIQEISARIGRVTGRGLAGNLKLHYPAVFVYSLVALLVVANTINLGADLGAMGAALKLVLGNGDPAKGGPALAYVAAFALLFVVLEIFVRYSRYVSVLKWLTLSLFAYVGVALMVHVPWATVGYHLVVPNISLSPGYLTVVVAILGTTISPYLFFWQAEEEVEEVKERPDANHWSGPQSRPSPSSAASGSRPISAWASRTWWLCSLSSPLPLHFTPTTSPTSRHPLRRRLLCALSPANSPS
jgi:Mn2+/Fe2+ NRAMP family transporter